MRSRKSSSVLLCDDLVSTSYRKWLSTTAAQHRTTNLVDTADAEAERTTFVTSAIHEVADEENELKEDG